MPGFSIEHVRGNRGHDQGKPYTAVKNLRNFLPLFRFSMKLISKIIKSATFENLALPKLISQKIKNGKKFINFYTLHLLLLIVNVSEIDVK